MTKCSLGEALKKLTPRVGIPDAYLCDTCNLFRSITPEINEWTAVNRPDLMARWGSDGVLSPVLACKCAEKAAQEAAKQAAREQERIDQANLPERHDAIGPRTWANFTATPTTRDMFEAVRMWAANDGPPFLFLCGITGTGKTHLAEAALRDLLARGEHVRYDTPEELLNRLRATVNRTQQTTAKLQANEIEIKDVGMDWDITQLTAWYEHIPALVLDDLGQQPPTPWGMGYVTRIIDQRYADGRRTLVTTNHSDYHEMARIWGERLASRLYDTHSGVVRVVMTPAGEYRRHGLGRS